MKLKAACFLFACFILCRRVSLFAEMHENDFSKLTEDIFEHFEQGCSFDEIIEKFGDKVMHTYSAQVLADHVDELLKRQKSEDLVVNVNVNNKESEEYYARKNFWIKVRNCLLGLKFIAALVLSLIILYLLSQWLRPEFKPWAYFVKFCGGEGPTVDDVSVSPNLATSDPVQPIGQTTEVDQGSETLGSFEPEQQQLTDANLENATEDFQPPQKNELQGDSTPSSGFQIFSDSLLFPGDKGSSPLAKSSKLAFVDDDLRVAIEKQIEAAKALGVKFEMAQ